MSECCATLSSVTSATARDPVCGAAIDITDATPSATYLGRIYFFRTPECRARFEAGPGPYIAELAGRQFRAFLWAGI